MQQTIKVSKVDSTALILGESGAGKELVADIIHKHSNRPSQPMIKINCGAIPESLVESELFGYGLPGLRRQKPKTQCPHSQ